MGDFAGSDDDSPMAFLANPHTDFAFFFGGGSLPSPPASPPSPPLPEEGVVPLGAPSSFLSRPLELPVTDVNFIPARPAAF